MQDQPTDHAHAERDQPVLPRRSSASLFGLPPNVRDAAAVPEHVLHLLGVDTVRSKQRSRRMAQFVGSHVRKARRDLGYVGTVSREDGLAAMM